MHIVENDSTIRLFTGKSTRPKPTTLLVAAVLLATLAISVPAQAQTKPSLVVTPLNAARFYGNTNPQFTGTVTGLVKGDTITVTYASVADTSSPVGDYQIVATLNDPDHHLANYVVTVNTGTLSVAPAPLSIVANDVTRAAGQANPSFAGTISGVQNGENITATYDSSATAGSPAGTYPILPTLKDGAGTIGNYALTISKGTLTITP